MADITTSNKISMAKIYLWLKENSILLVLLAIAAILRLYHIDYQSLWLDEIHTMNECSPSLTLKELYNVLCNIDPHPPLYFLLVKVSFYVFGYTTLTLRIVSALLGIAGVWSIYMLGKELYNKKAGLIAALLLTVNYFHISYSQDARPYPLLFLTTTISVYFLVRFIKMPTVKNSLLYGFFTGIMLYSHLFSLFALCSQCVILLYFVVWPYISRVTPKRMLWYSILSGVVIIVMYLPCLEIFFMAASRTSMWIPKPEPDAYIELLKEFFGNFDIQLVFIGMAALLFVVGLIKEKRRQDNPPITKLSALVLFTWIFITLLLPWIKSYVGLPVIVSRYFINILPAVILIIAIGVVQIKNKLLVYVLTGVMVLLSLYNIFARKDYYNTIKKTQFREATNFIIENNTNEDPVITSLGWYFPFFLKNEAVNYTIIERSLDDHVSMMINNSSEIESFWYIDAHSRPYKVSYKTQQFLDRNFVVEDNYEGFDIWTKHYKTGKKRKINSSSLGTPISQSQINYNIEKFEYNENVLKVSGWAILKNLDSSKSRIKIYLIKDEDSNEVATIMGRRQDVTAFLKLQYNANNSGFQAEYNTSDLEPGKYSVGIYIENKQYKKRGLMVTDKKITVSN